MMRVALVYNLKGEQKDANLPLDFYSEFDSEKTIGSIADAIAKGGNEVLRIEANGDFLEKILENREKIDIVFNIAEGCGGASRESRVPAMLDYLGIPYTGSGVLALALALDKALSKKIFRHEGIPTPNFQLFKTPYEPLEPLLKFPLIVKPNSEGSGKGIFASSVVCDETRLYEQVESVYEMYNHEVLVEEFIAGKELTVGVMGNGDLTVLPILEIDFSTCKQSGEYFYSWRMKEYQGDESRHMTPSFFCPARIDDGSAELVKKLARKAHLSLGCCDFSRTDIRLARDGIPYVLEVNPLPGLDPLESNFPYIAKSAGIEYAALVNQILQNAVERYGLGEDKSNEATTYGTSGATKRPPQR